MTPEIRRRFNAWKTAPRSWEPGQGGKVALLSWNDSLTKDLGEDSDGSRLQELGTKLLNGHYYPDDVIEFFGEWQDEGRLMRAGDKILQRAHLAFGIKLWAMVEVFVAEMSDDVCRLGYVTTQKHFGKGQWEIVIRRNGSRLRLEVSAISGPGSFLFWIGLPIARYYQMRAWRKALSSFGR